MPRLGGIGYTTGVSVILTRRRDDKSKSCIVQTFQFSERTVALVSLLPQFVRVRHSRSIDNLLENESRSVTVLVLWNMVRATAGSGALRSQHICLFMSVYQSHTNPTKGNTITTYIVVFMNNLCQLELVSFEYRLSETGTWEAIWACHNLIQRITFNLVRL